MDLIPVIKSSLILFAIVNPIGSIPIFLQLTHHMQSQDRLRAFRTGILSSAVILFVFIIAGESILKSIFQIRLSDLMAAGGLLLIIIAIDHLVFGSLVRGVLSNGEQDAEHIGAVPIACPILAGPGAMMTAFIIHSQYGLIVAVSAIAIVIGLTWLILRYIDLIYKVLGRIVCIVLSKILCLFIAAIGIRLLMQGIVVYFK